VVIDYLNFLSVSANPAKASSKLIVHANAPLSGPIALELFETISGWCAQIVDASRQLELLELSQRRSLEVRETGDTT
jgi:hypothetical protein